MSELLRDGRPEADIGHRHQARGLGTGLFGEFATSIESEQEPAPVLLLTLADGDVAHWWSGSRSITPAGLRDQGACWTSIAVTVAAPERARLAFPVGRPGGTDS